MEGLNNKNKENIPWIEKYRPTHFDNIVLSPINRKIFENIFNHLFNKINSLARSSTIVRSAFLVPTHCLSITILTSIFFSYSFFILLKKLITSLAL